MGCGVALPSRIGALIMALLSITFDLQVRGAMEQHHAIPTELYSHNLTVGLLRKNGHRNWVIRLVV
jgi:hypothetical protein